MATGQVACTDVKGISHIRIWDAKSLATLNVLRYKGADMSVECLSFSQVCVEVVINFFVNFLKTLLSKC